jgi:hypothetical protein
VRDGVDQAIGTEVDLVPQALVSRHGSRRVPEPRHTPTVARRAQSARPLLGAYAQAPGHPLAQGLQHPAPPTRRDGSAHGWRNARLHRKPAGQLGEDAPGLLDRYARWIPGAIRATPGRSSWPRWRAIPKEFVPSSSQRTTSGYHKKAKIPSKSMSCLGLRLVGAIGLENNRKGHPGAIRWKFPPSLCPRNTPHLPQKYPPKYPGEDARRSGRGATGLMTSCPGCAASQLPSWLSRSSHPSPSWPALP